MYNSLSLDTINPTDAERFIRKVKKDSGCWLWTAAVGSSGYGLFLFGNRTIRAHRFGYALFKGDLPSNKQVQHLCNRRQCVNPDHLVLGVPRENHDYMKLSGRGIAGSKHPKTKFTEKDVRTIRERYAAGGITQTELGDEYGVCQVTIQQIVSGKNWTLAPGPITRKCAFSPRKSRKLTPSQRKEIVQRYNAGEYASALAREYGVSESLVCRLAKAKITRKAAA